MIKIYPIPAIFLNTKHKVQVVIIELNAVQLS